jgi:hypothetical protein
MPMVSCIGEASVNKPIRFVAPEHRVAGNLGADYAWQPDPAYNNGPISICHTAPEEMGV